MKRKLALALSALLCCAAIAGCGASQKDGYAVVDPEDSLALFGATRDEVRKKYPNITETTKTLQHDTKLLDKEATLLFSFSDETEKVEDVTYIITNRSLDDAYTQYNELFTQIKSLEGTPSWHKYHLDNISDSKDYVEGDVKSIIAGNPSQLTIQSSFKGKTYDVTVSLLKIGESFSNVMISYKKAE